MPEDSLHSHKVNNAFESLLRTDRNLDGKRSCAEHLLHLTNNLEEVCARAVHLVYITDTGNVIFVSLTPHSLTLRLNTAYRTECSDSTVKHAERTLNLYSEVNVSGGVNQVDFKLVVVIFPESGGSGGSNCDTTLLLLLHPVHGGCAIVNLTDLVSKTCIEEDTLRSGGFSGIDVSHDADIAG